MCRRGPSSRASGLHSYGNLSKPVPATRNDAPYASGQWNSLISMQSATCSNGIMMRQQLLPQSDACALSTGGHPGHRFRDQPSRFSGKPTCLLVLHFMSRTARLHRFVGARSTIRQTAPDVAMQLRTASDRLKAAGSRRWLHGGCTRGRSAGDDGPLSPVEPTSGKRRYGMVALK